MKTTICYCSAQPGPLWTHSKRLFLFIEASNNIWHRHVRLRVKLCEGERVCVCEAWSCLRVGTVGKHLSVKREVKWKHQLCSNLPFMVAPNTHTHLSNFKVVKVPLKEKDCVTAFDHFPVSAVQKFQKWFDSST